MEKPAKNADRIHRNESEPSNSTNRGAMLAYGTKSIQKHKQDIWLSIQCEIRKAYGVTNIHSPTNSIHTSEHRQGRDSKNNEMLFNVGTKGRVEKKRLQIKDSDK